MTDDGFKVFDTNADVQALINSKLIKIERVDGNGRLQRLLENFASVHDFLRITCERSPSTFIVDVQQLGLCSKVLAEMLEGVGADGPVVPARFFVEERTQNVSRLVLEPISLFDARLAEELYDQVTLNALGIVLDLHLAAFYRTFTVSGLPGPGPENSHEGFVVHLTREVLEAIARRWLGRAEVEHSKERIFVEIKEHGGSFGCVQCCQ